MPSGLIVLASYNKEDSFIVGNPSMSHFRSVYKHHSPFVSEYRQIQFESRVSFGQTTISLDIPKDGDLLRKMWRSITKNVVKNQCTRCEWVLLDK